MKQKEHKMTANKPFSLTVATIGLALACSAFSAQANEPLDVKIAQNDAASNYPPADFDPEKKPEADKGSGDQKQPQQPATQHQWPNAEKNTTSQTEYPPKSGIDLTPAPKTAVAKPKLKYPEFPSVSWPKKKVELPEYAPFPTVDYPQDEKGNPVYPPFPTVEWSKDAQGNPIYPPFPTVTPPQKAVDKKADTPAKTEPQEAQSTTGAQPVAPSGQSGQWAPPPQPSIPPSGQWGPPPQPWQQPGISQAELEKYRQDQEAERQAAMTAAKAWQAEQQKLFKAQQGEAKRQWEAQQAELKKARAVFESQRAEQEKILKTRQNAMKKQWETQQAELERSRKAHDAEVKKREAEVQKMLKAREDYQRRQYEKFQKEMHKARATQQAEMKKQAGEMKARAAAQRKAMEAELAKIRQQADKMSIPPLPPKIVAKKPPAGQPLPQPPAGGNWAGNQRHLQLNRPGGWNGNWRPQLHPNWQFHNRLHPAWRNNPNWYWRPPYPYGQGYYPPRR